MSEKLYKIMNWPKVEEVVYSECDHPYDILGAHKLGREYLIQEFYPDANTVFVKIQDKIYPMEKMDDAGFFACLIPSKEFGEYELEIHYSDAVVNEKSAYCTPLAIETKDLKKFQAGIHYEIYRLLGAHVSQDVTRFAVWAPNAVRVSVVGDFNLWDGRKHQMQRLGDSGVFEIAIPQNLEGLNYKFEIKNKLGVCFLKADPYGYQCELRPNTASVVRDIEQFQWTDDAFLGERKAFQSVDGPISVYELYLGSFTDPKSGMEYANYREIVGPLIDYMHEMNYTHVELMPVMEHPFDGSWGYQVTGYFAPTSRYGTAEDFMYFINELHMAGIGVILDWVPAHFPKDAHGLANFDGTCLYEHLDPRLGQHPQWGTLLYNYRRPEVSNFLISNALFWVEKYHADGIRVDAVASMLYLDFGREEGQWIPNIYGGNENLDAIEFMKHLNSIMHKRNPGVLMIAEESTAFPLITGALDEGGLGFDLKWNMGFMNDYIRYIKNDPYFRSYHHGELTFSMIYAYSERFLLPFSHDEVVHGKSTMIGKMPGTREDKFRDLRLTYGYYMMHPGKKLLFMGQELGEFDEWNENRRVFWGLRNVPEHEGVRKLVSDLNLLYTTQKAFYELETVPDGFEWINSISGNDCYISFARHGKGEDDFAVVVCNFSGVDRELTTGVPKAGKYKEILNTDHTKYGGSGFVNPRVKASKKHRYDERENSITVKVAAGSVAILKYVP